MTAVADRLGQAVGRRSDWADALRAEWTKLRTTAGPAGLLVAVAVLTMATGAAVAASVRYDGSGQDPVRLALTGVQVAQILVAVIGVTVVSSEYGTGTMATTLTALPRRATVLGAKALLVIGTVLGAGLVGVAGSLLAGRWLLPGAGFTAAHGYPPLSITDGPTLRAAIGSVAYLGFIALLSLGVATVARDAAGSVGVVLALLYGFPLVARAFNDLDWRRRLLRLSPADAGLAVQDTILRPDRPIGPLAGLAVLAGWTAISLVVGAVLFHHRDA